MQRKLQLSPARWAMIVVLLLLLISVRMFEKTLFYDPFIAFFKHSGQPGLPVFSTPKLFLHYLLRYTANTILSMGILWVFFRDKSIIKLTSVLYTAVFIILSIALFIVLQTGDPSQKLIFYLRRFLIQPLLLLLFIPAFYFQKYIKK